MGVVDKDENSYYSILKDLKKNTNTIRKVDRKKNQMEFWGLKYSI